MSKTQRQDAADQLREGGEQITELRENLLVDNRAPFVAGMLRGVEAQLQLAHQMLMESTEDEL